MSNNITFAEDVSKASDRIDNLEQCLAKGLFMPFNSSTSGSRNLLFSTQLEHKLPLMRGEVPLLGTGYEPLFGEYSSSFIRTDSEYDVIERVEKFGQIPGHHYYLIVFNKKKQEFDMIERKSYEHITESYGYLYDNTNIDKYKSGSSIYEGEVIRKSTSFDEFNNRKDGVNLNTGYISCEKTKEDGIIICESARRKLASPLIRKIKIIQNDNDLPLNIYGNDELYKSFPDIGEETSNKILCALRREKKEESLFSLSCTRLKNIMMSDERFIAEGKVIDINVFCNNPDNLNSVYTSQIKYYYDQQQVFLETFVNATKEIVGKYKCSYALQKMHYNYKKILEGGQYIQDKPFSNNVIEITLLEESLVNVGDKISNRYGGKGVVSCILPDHLMPRMDNGQYIELIYNSSTCVNRGNPGQLYETSINHIGGRIVDFVSTGTLEFADQVEMYLGFLRHLSPDLSAHIENSMLQWSVEDQRVFMEGVFTEEGIAVSMKPISEAIDIDKLRSIYKEFSFAMQNKIIIPQKDSMGNIRYIPARRAITCGKQYIYRLKQYAEEKFSAVSLSATNIKNENTRNASKKNYKSAYSKTPIRFGEMEQGDFGHLGMEVVIVNLMLHSTSPHGRRLAEELLTGDPFSVDIKLDEDSKNRSVEVNNAFLTTMGLELEFVKVRKVQQRLIQKSLVTFKQPTSNKLVQGVWFPKEWERLDPVEFIDGFKHKDTRKFLALKSMVTFGKKLDEETGMYKKED